VFRDGPAAVRRRNPRNQIAAWRNIPETARRYLAAIDGRQPAAAKLKGRDAMFTRTLTATATAALVAFILAGPAQAGVKKNSLTSNGTVLNGILPNGISINGKSVNSMSVNGFGPNGASLNGRDLNGRELNGRGLNGLGVTIDSIELPAQLR
jgi:hypothetical protein